MQGPSPGARCPLEPRVCISPAPSGPLQGGGTPEPGPATCSPAPLGPRASPEPGSLPGRLPFDPAEAGKTGSPGTGPEAGNLTLKPAGGRGALPAASEAQEACGVPSAGPPGHTHFPLSWFPLGTFPACPRGGLLRPKDGVLSVPVLYYLPRSATPHLRPASATSSAIVLLLVSRALFFPQRPVFAVSGLALRIGSHITGSYCHLSKFDTLLLCSPAAGASFRRPGIGHCSSQVPNLHLRAKKKHLSYLTLEKRRVVWTFQQQESLSQMWLPPLRFSEVWLHEKWALDDFRT